MFIQISLVSTALRVSMLLMKAMVSRHGSVAAKMLNKQCTRDGPLTSYFLGKYFILGVMLASGIFWTLHRCLYVPEVWKSSPPSSRGDVLASRLTRRQITWSLASADILLTVFYSVGVLIKFLQSWKKSSDHNLETYLQQLQIWKGSACNKISTSIKFARKYQ